MSPACRHLSSELIYELKRDPYNCRNYKTLVKRCPDGCPGREKPKRQPRKTDEQGSLL